MDIPKKMEHDGRIVYHGQRVTCIINDTRITDGVISLDGDMRPYICQDKRDGGHFPEKFGFTKAWSAKNGFEDEGITNLELNPAVLTEVGLFQHEDSCTGIFDKDRISGKIAIQRDSIYFCQDHASGMAPADTLGYKYGYYLLSDSRDSILSTIVIYNDKSSHKVEWKSGNPDRMVEYEDEEEEEEVIRNNRHELPPKSLSIVNIKRNKPKKRKRIIPSG